MISVRGAFAWRSLGDMTFEYHQTNHRSKVHFSGHYNLFLCLIQPIAIILIILTMKNLISMRGAFTLRKVEETN